MELEEDMKSLLALNQENQVRTVILLKNSIWKTRHQKRPWELHVNSQWFPAIHYTFSLVDTQHCQAFGHMGNFQNNYVIHIQSPKFLEYQVSLGDFQLSSLQNRAICIGQILDVSDTSRD